MPAYLKAYRREEYEEIIKTDMANDPVARVQFGADGRQGQCGEDPGDSKKRWSSILITSHGGQEFHVGFTRTLGGGR